MFRSRNHTIGVPVINTVLAGQTPPAPAVLIENVEVDCIVKVRNNSMGVFVLLSFDPAALQAVPAASETYKLPAGETETFIIAAGQGLYASTTSGPPDGSGAEISFHIAQSEPVDDQSSS